jgi:hypothetical protein
MLNDTCNHYHFVTPAPEQVHGKIERESGKKLDSGSSPE